MVLKKNLGDDLAQGMSSVLEDEGYQRIFAKPKIASASAQPSAEKVINDAKSAFDALIEISAELDEMGLSKSAMKTLQAAHMMMSEVNPELVDEDMEEDEDLKQLLEELGESQEVMDVPSELDKPEGNPENL